MLVIGLLALALAVRLWGIADRLPDPALGVNPIVGDTAVDEGDRRAMLYAWEMWRGGTQDLDLNPTTGDWPGLPFYLTLSLQSLYGAYYSATHGGASSVAFSRHAESDPAAMFLFARFFNACLGVLTVYLVYRLGSLLGGRSLGIVAALLLALNPFHILTSQRVCDPNLLALLFVLIATIQLVGIGRGDSLRAPLVAGAMIGLAGACKYVPLVLISLLVIACVDAPEWPSLRRLRFRWKQAAIGIAAALVAFALASPYTLLDWGRKAQDLSLQSGRMLGDWVGLSESRFSLLTYLTRTLPSMLGWPAYLLSVAGCVLLLRHPRRGWIVALVPAVLLLPTGLLALAQERFIMPALGSLVVAAGYAILRLAMWLKERVKTPRAAVAAASLLVVLSIAWPVPAYVHTRERLRLPDTRRLAHYWIEKSIPPEEPLALDLYGPEFDLREGGRLALLWPFLASQTAYVQAAYHPEWLDGFRYYVTSSETERRFEAAAGRYTDEAAFHRWIRSNGVVLWRSDSMSASGPSIEVRALPERISSAETRDSLWERVRGGPAYGPRLARWCSEMAMIFLKRNQYDRAAEWAARGLSIPDGASRKELFETLSLSEVRLGRLSEGEHTARAGLQRFPDSALLHLNRAMALEALSRKKEAISEYLAALRFTTNPEGAAIIRAQVARLQ